MFEEKLKLYDSIINQCTEFNRLGKGMPHTATNTYMFSMLNKAGEIGIRLSKEDQESFCEKHNTGAFKSYGSVIKDYVLVPDSVLNEIDLVVLYFTKSFIYTNTLKAQPRK